MHDVITCSPISRQWYFSSTACFDHVSFKPESTLPQARLQQDSLPHRNPALPNQEEHSCLMFFFWITTVQPPEL